jgi:hypothetical protein
LQKSGVQLVFGRLQLRESRDACGRTIRMVAHSLGHEVMEMGMKYAERGARQGLQGFVERAGVGHKRGHRDRGAGKLEGLDHGLQSLFVVGARKP